ncbi:MAG: molybdopterin-dependent oxidoreductase [Rubrivivax sp.]|nr:molybdopterin-dependent oxidoreductase [Rubrivivax sp.]
MKVDLKRRGVLAALATTAAGLSVTFGVGCALPVIPKRPKPGAADALAWVRHEAGRYTLFIPRIEMGQNVLTALKQIACQELGIAWSELDAQVPGTRDIGRVRATVGSDSVKDFALLLAQACATLREGVAAGHRGTLAAKEWPPASLRAFAGGGPFVGRVVALEQGLKLVTGQALFASDVRLPGLCFGRVLRAPVSPELPSSLMQADEAAARRVPGFVALVQDEALALGRSQGLGLVARTPAALDRIEAALVPQWRVEGSFEQADIDAAVDIDTRLAGGRFPRHKVKDEGADDRVDGSVPWDVDLRIDIPLAAHGAIEPRVAVAAFDGSGQLQVWAGTQDAFYVADVLARQLRLPLDSIDVRPQRVGGAFGGKTICTVELEAAVLARAAGVPVKVQWNREQELRQGFHRPPSSHRLRARVRDGRLVDWWHAQVSSHILLTNAAAPPWLQQVALLIGDDGVARGAKLPYRALRRRAGFDLQRLPVFTGPWRGLGAGPNGLAIESAIDECARVASADPLQFRIDHAQDPRLAGVLRSVGQAAGWAGAALAAGSGLKRGRGVAGGVYKGSSYAAVVADVEVDTTTGLVRVRRLWCAHDCGRVINPDQVRAQCEGNLVWGLGMVFSDRLDVASSRVAATGFADAPVPRMADIPDLEVLLVESEHASGGAGETAIVAAAGAIANALRQALGIRWSRFPVRPAEVLRALQAPGG